MTSRHTALIADIDPAQPVLIAGPTASGKSALALEIAAAQGGCIVNADASQVYGCWRILTARPSPQEESEAPHKLYGHVAVDDPYSTGHWLREVAQLLNGPERPIIVGGTGLYFAALTGGLADIPATPPQIRAEGNLLSLAALLHALDPRTRAGIDTANRARVQRAWEVLRATGRGLADWQTDTPPPLLDAGACARLRIDVDRDLLNDRIATRFDQMLATGALDEVAAQLPSFDPALPAHRAIGVPELVGYLRGEHTLDAARDAAIRATRRYAKRQRTFARNKLTDWTAVPI